MQKAAAAAKINNGELAPGEILKTCYNSGAFPGFGRGGGPRIFFSRFGKLHVAKRHAAHGEAMRFARGVRGHAPPRKFFKMVQFGAFWCIF